MAEHEVARLVVHFGLEGELVLQRDCPRRSRSCRYLIDQPLYIGKFGVDLFAEHEWREPRPTPERHIDDRVGIADHVAAVGAMTVEDGVMASPFELAAGFPPFPPLPPHPLYTPPLPP